MTHVCSRRLAATTLLGLIGFVDCSPGASAEAGFETELSGATLLAELSEVEVSQLCGDALRFTDSLAPYECRLNRVGAALTGLSLDISDAQLIELCESADCERGSDPGDMPEPACSVPPHCTASVSDVAACYADLGDLLRASVADLPDCPELSRELLEGLEWDVRGNALRPATPWRSRARGCHRRLWSSRSRIVRLSSRVAPRRAWSHTAC